MMNIDGHGISAALTLAALDHDLEMIFRETTRKTTIGIINPEASLYGYKHNRHHTAGGSYNKQSGSDRKAAKAAKKARRTNRRK